MLEASLKKILILGYGNADRQDDGVAWHVLNGLAGRLGRAASVSPDEGFSTFKLPSEEGGSDRELLFVLQLTPEMAEIISEFDRVCFIDAHTGNVPGEVNLSRVEAEFQASPFTHHLTPQSCLALCAALYSKQPEAILVSVRGYEFGFDRSLSPQTSQHVEAAVAEIWKWLGKAPREEAPG
jgi:hydrogenase maturation protease